MERTITFPDKQKVLHSYSHNLMELVRTAGLEAALQGAIQQNQALRDKWAVVKDWSESSRYNLNIIASQAQDMITAIKDPVNGVLTWLILHW